MARLRKESWHERPRMSRLSSVLYPHMTDQETQDQMAKLAANEKRKPPEPPTLLDDRTRGAVSPLGNVAKGWPDKKGK
jgi:hypothetical protein